jgi:maleylacetoacetate isomerase
MKLVLHNYWRSSASHRVRIALGLKQLPFEYVAVNILTGAQLEPGYRDLNASAQVPTLEVIEDDGSRRLLVQSLPILEYLEDRFAAHPILPADHYLRARARGLAEIINSGIQPHQNLTTTKKLESLGVAVPPWVKSFIAEGMIAYAQACAAVAGSFSVGDTPSIADCCLVPQLASARRFSVLADNAWDQSIPGIKEQLPKLSRLLEIEGRCLAIKAFADAMPDQQPDAVKS